jgi:hypothetical protein
MASLKTEPSDAEQRSEQILARLTASIVAVNAFIDETRFMFEPSRQRSQPTPAGDAEQEPTDPTAQD